MAVQAPQKPTVANPKPVQSNVPGAAPPKTGDVPSATSAESVVETVAEEKKTREKPVEHYGSTFNTEDEATRAQPKMKDGSIWEAGKLCVVTLINGGKKFFVWARNPDHALSFVASDTYTWELAHPGERGKPRKIDPIYLSYAKALKANKQDKDLAAFLVEYPQYESHLS